MDHEIVPRSCKICDWLLNSFWDHFGLHQGNNTRVTMKVSKRHILRPTLSTDMVQWILWRKGKRGALVEKGKGHMAKKCYYKIFLRNSFWGREDEGKRRRETGQTWVFYLKLPFLDIYWRKKKSHSLLVHDRSSWFIVGLHLVRGPKAL